MRKEITVALIVAAAAIALAEGGQRVPQGRARLSPRQRRGWPEDSPPGVELVARRTDQGAVVSG